MKQKEGVSAASAGKNRLGNETSPYLLQHADNPVDWYPWGEEALTRARQENKPILLSIGYSACHWCHVMAHESFENEAIARLMNENFINIKVDREERPDLDQIYMNAVQMMTHHGGWPMTVFLTPEGIPFYGGTYFPPEDRYNMPGFPRVLLSVAEAFRERRDDISNTTSSLLSELRRVSGGDAKEDLLTTEVLATAYQGLVKNFDRVEGGFGGAPKFPPAMALEFLLRTFHRTKNNEALEIVAHTCRKMANGGIYDQLGGGFHRYSTDARWLVPHFEKMLYDNALLSRLYLHYFQASGENWAREVAEGILKYVLREMTNELGGFYSSQDADSEGHEGKFFVWTMAEVEQLLGKEEADLFSAYYNLTTEGNFEGQNILNITSSIDEVAAARNVSSQRLSEVIERGKNLLFSEREKRVKPDRDEKILTAWNGLMLTSFSLAGAILRKPEYLETARRNASFILAELRRDDLLLRTWKDGRARFNAYLEDYAFLVDGLLTLYETSGELRWFEEALQLTKKMVEEFWDETEGGFFFTGQSHEQLIVRAKDYFDNATPSGNSVAAEVLLRIAHFTGNSDFERRALTVLRQVSQSARRYPTGFGRALGVIDFHFSQPKEIVVIVDDIEAEEKLLEEIWKHYLPNKIITVSQVADSRTREFIPLASNRPLVDGKPTAYVCQQRSCQAPVTDPKALRRQLLS